MADTYDAGALRQLATDLLTHAGLEADKAADVAETLVEGDLLGQTTHGLNLLGPYLDALANGRDGGVRRAVVVADAAAWRDLGRRLAAWALPGARRRGGSRRGRRRIAGLGAVAIRRSSHLGCLGAYLRPAAEAGLHDAHRQFGPGRRRASRPGAGPGPSTRPTRSRPGGRPRAGR